MFGIINKDKDNEDVYFNCIIKKSNTTAVKMEKKKYLKISPKKLFKELSFIYSLDEHRIIGGIVQPTYDEIYEMDKYILRYVVGGYYCMFINKFKKMMILPAKWKTIEKNKLGHIVDDFLYDIARFAKKNNDMKVVIFVDAN